MKTYLRLLATVAATLVSIITLAAAGQTYLPAQKAAAMIADGKPWSADAPNGRAFKLTLNKDGTGSIGGAIPFTLSATWAVKGDALCIANTMLSKCLRFSQVPGALQGWDGDKPDLKLSR